MDVTPIARKIAANYLQYRQGYQRALMDGKPKPNNSELVVRNWYNPNLDYKWFCGALADRHDPPLLA